MVGRTISHYRVEEKLGGGAMGVVYRAVDLKLDRPVALKFLPDQFAHDEAAKRRFVQEAKAASRLDHPHIATVYEIGETDGGHLFIVMPFYEGETLKQKIARGPVPIKDAVEWALQVARGLEAAHRAGIVHRDLKPANVMITGRGRAKIVDFGLAKVAGVELTASGSTLGTAAYMSPEQARGDAVDGRSDLWSLGVLLYEMLTAERPLRGEYAEAIVYAILHEEPPPVRDLRPDVPEGLARLVEDLLHKDPSDRPPEARVVARRLEAVRGRRRAPGKEDRPREERGFLRRLASGALLSKRRVALLAGVIVLAGLFIVLGRLSFSEHISAESRGPQDEQAGPAGMDGWSPRLGAKSIAVLPFTYLAAEDSSDYFSQGMTDELLIRLSQLEDLSVISRTSVMQYLNSGKTIPEIARELGVAYVLEGNVQQVGGQVRIQAQLIDARTDRHVWADGFTRPFRDVLKLQVDLAREIAGELQVTMRPEEERRLAAAPEVDSVAYALYLQARRLRVEQTGESLAAAVRLARRSVAIDSTFAPAWAVLSVSAWLAPFFGQPYSNPEDPYGWSLARQAAGQALELDSANAEAQIAMGRVRMIVDGDFPSAGLHLQKAVRLNPNLSEAHREYGSFLMRAGEFEAADRYLSRAVRLDPVSPVALHSLALNDLYRGDYERAKERLRQTLTVQPGNIWARSDLARAYCQQDSLDAARRELGLAAANAQSAGTVPLAQLGAAYALCGLRDSARSVIERIRESPPHAGRSLHEAMVFAALGATDEAFQLLERSELFWLGLRVNPVFESLRSDPRYNILLRRYGWDDESVRRTMEELGEQPL